MPDFKPEIPDFCGNAIAKQRAYWYNIKIYRNRPMDAEGTDK